MTAFCQPDSKLRGWECIRLIILVELHLRDGIEYSILKMKMYNHKSIEKKWRERWEKEKVFVPDIKGAKNPFYNLMMFPYPSAEGLHVGNMYAFTGADIYGRYNRMRGKDVFEPMGLDGFGIHSENYAIKVGRHPKEHAKVSQENFYNQLALIGNGFAWDYKLETYDPEYYKWTQWLFVKMYKAEMAYKDKAMVNWCPSCKTVLSDEQVVAKKEVGKTRHDIDYVEEVGNESVCERCGTVVERREMNSWFFKITKYADRLLANIEKINWPEKIKIAQRQWIGKSTGLSIKFQIPESKIQTIVWTKFWETIFGTTFLVVAPEYARENLMNQIPNNKKTRVSEYIEVSLSKSEQERKAEKQKTGIFTGIYAINPANNKEVPIWISDYVLAGVGTGAVMGVPAHDERDFEFAKKYNLDIKPVIVLEREYIDENAKDYYQKRSRLHKELLQVLLDVANKNNKKLMLSGGWAVYAHVGTEFRDFEDLDLIIMEEDVDWWKEKVVEMGLKIENLFPDKNNKYYFQAIKKDVHVDILAIRINKNNKVEWLDDAKPKESDEFDKIFEEKTLFDNSVFVMNKDLIYYLKSKHKGEKRWKEKADFLFMGFESYEGEGKLINSDKFDGLDAWGEGKSKMAEWMLKQGVAYWETNYHLRDWLISRQRYWGPPIPMINCSDCGWQPVSEKDLPILLPDIQDFKPQGDGTSPLHNAPESWKVVNCPKCGKKANRELDVSDTFLDSSWYFLAYPNLDTKEWKSSESPLNNEITKRWLPVNAYIGGAEHAVLHLLYARFVTMFLMDEGHVDFEEPFPFLFGHGLIIKDGAKMSKSKGNIVNPDEYISKFGADTLRLYLMFLGPYDSGGDFRDSGIEGMRRFVNKVWVLADALRGIKLSANDNDVLRIKMHQTIKKVTDDISEFKYNTAISAIMEYVNLLRDVANEYQKSNIKIQNEISKLENEKINRQIRYAEWDEALRTLILLLAPFAPHMAEEIWVNILGREFSVHKAPWPEYDEKLTVESTVEIPVQVNGKLRGTLQVELERSEDKEFIISSAKSDSKIGQWLEGKKIKKEIFVPGRLVNFVV